MARLEFAHSDDRWHLPTSQMRYARSARQSGALTSSLEPKSSTIGTAGGLGAMCVQDDRTPRCLLAINRMSRLVIAGPMSVHDVVAAVDIERLTCDQLGTIHS